MRAFPISAQLGESLPPEWLFPWSPFFGSVIEVQPGGVHEWTIAHPSKAMEVCQEKTLTQNRWSIICLQLQRAKLLVKWSSVMHQISNLSRTTVVILYEKYFLRVFPPWFTVISKHHSNRTSTRKRIQHLRVFGKCLDLHILSNKRLVPHPEPAISNLF